MKIHIKNGRLIDPASGTDAKQDVYIAAGKIAGIGAARLADPDVALAADQRRVDHVDLGQLRRQEAGQRRRGQRLIVEFGDRALIATKVWSSSADDGRRQADAALRYYGGRVDVYRVHNLLAWRTQLTLLERLRDRGAVRVIGATHYQASALPELETLATDVAMVPIGGTYTMDAEEAEDMGQLEHAQDLNTPENMLMSQQVADTVNQTLEKLPEELRTAISLREMEGLSYEEIASVMNCPIGTVRSRIFRAREAIAGELRPLLGTGKDRRW